MASSYPTSLDSFTDPTSGSSLASPSHSGQHIDLNDAVEKLETKLGIGSSAASSATNGAVLVANGSGTTTWSGYGLGRFAAWTPTVAASTGTFTTITVDVARYTRIGNVVNGYVSLTVTAIGSASGYMYFTVPTGLNLSSSYQNATAIGDWRESALVGFCGVFTSSNTGADRIALLLYNGGTYLGNGYSFRGSFSYEVA